MKLRTTLLLVMAAVAVGVIVYINPFKKSPELQEASPWFYQVDEDDIDFIEIIHQGDRARFVRVAPYSWAFEDPEGIPPSHYRWGGITLLFTGPQTRRDLTVAAPIIEDPAQYGLDDPGTIVNVGLTLDRELQFRLGDTTTDGNHHYAQVGDFPQLYIIASAWGDVVARLVTERPYPEWYVKRDPEEIREVNVYKGDPTSEETPVLRFGRKRDGTWLVRDFAQDADATPVDTERWEEILPLLSGPTSVSVEAYEVEDRDYTPWGIADDSRAIELRFLGRTERGTSFLDGVLFKIGSKTPDGQGYYARVEEDIIRKPVLVVDAEWTDKLLGLYEDIPRARQPNASTPAQSN